MCITVDTIWSLRTLHGAGTTFHCDGQSLPIFDQHGQMISQDRQHFTKFGAIYAGPIVVRAPEQLCGAHPILMVWTAPATSGG